jgi:choline dehydrogenase
MSESLTFDYIVVGAGSAGCVLAARLTEDGRHSVLLLEAGGEDRNPWIHVPLGYGKLFVDPKVNWLYQSEPEPELGGRRIPQPRGKVLGGSSSINGLVYIRGQKEDFDGWRQLGNAGWSHADVLPYFRRAEDQQRGPDEHHGAGGPLAVSDQRDPHPLCEAFIAAATEEGIPRNDDFNGATQEGAGYFQLTARNGFRCSTARGYLRPARKRPNLRVLTDALSTRLLFEGRRATGVEFVHGGEPRQARANKEVIVASGAINSPQLLQLSGLGPVELLQRHGVPVIADMPGVGDALQDHFQVRMVFKSRTACTLNDALLGWRGKAAMGLRYAFGRRGWLAIGAGYAGAFFRTDGRLATPDIQTHFILFSTEKMGTTLHPWSGFTASVCQLRPESRGWVRIRNGDPRTPPAIQPNYLKEELDRATVVAGLKKLRRLMEAKPLEPFVAAEAEPGRDCVEDAALLQYARDHGSTIYHPTCTCRMGSDPTAVVDERLRVRGVGGLRVIDGSIMPSVVSGNTNAAIVMIAEKGADMILEDAR